ncbi:MAG: VPLPA-CTERM sorting domain-containing protein [Pseudomonadota bacterium]
MRELWLSGVVLLGLSSVSIAAPITFFGENLSPGGTVSGDPLAARNQFLAALSGGVGTENFEVFGLGTNAPLDLSFPGSSGSITATLAGGGAEIDNGGSGRFPTSGAQYVETNGGGDFDVTFSSPIAAFGFYGTDLGDIGNDLVITLTDTNSVDTMFTLDLSGSPNGALVFWGFVNPSNTYTSVRFDNTPTSGDVFGFDDLTVGDVNQVIITPPAVPLPATVFLLLGSLAGFGVLRRLNL